MINNYNDSKTSKFKKFNVFNRAHHFISLKIEFVFMKCNNTLLFNSLI